MFEIVWCLEVEIDVAACCGLEHLIGGIVEVVVVEAVRGGGKWGRERKCQGALTVGKRACVNLPEGLQGGVRLQRLGDVLCALSTDAVLVETASGSRTQAQTNVRGR